MKDSDYSLEHAISELDEQLVRRAIFNGANPNGTDPIESILHDLAYEYSLRKTTAGDRILKVAEILLEAGADPNLVGRNNWRAIDIALDDGHMEFVKLLARYGANPNMREFT